MKRATFLARLKHGLDGMDPAQRAEILLDYENYFAEGLAAGRDDAELAAALGSPARVASELRLAAGLQRWRAERSATAAARVALALGAMVVLDLLAVVPASVALVVAAAVLLVSALTFPAGLLMIVFGAAGGAPADALRGAGVLSAAVAGGALATLMLIGLADLAGWSLRMHRRALHTPSRFQNEA